VYSVEFHPTDPLLVSASADFGVKLWSFRARNHTLR
jgi:WD40 repeat protein